MPRPSPRFRPSPPVPVDCPSVRAALSAALDGEDPGMPPASARRHVEACPGCRAFGLAAGTLDGQLGVLPSRPVPAAVLDRVLAGAGVAGSVAPASAGTPPGARRPGDGVGRRVAAAGRALRVQAAVAAADGHPWRRAARWATVTTPVAALSIALPLGALGQPRLDPTHQPTPCTASLAHHAGHPGS